MRLSRAGQPSPHEPLMIGRPESAEISQATRLSAILEIKGLDVEPGGLSPV